MKHFRKRIIFVIGNSFQVPLNSCLVTSVSIGDVEEEIFSNACKLGRDNFYLFHIFKSVVYLGLRMGVVEKF